MNRGHALRIVVLAAIVGGSLGCDDECGYYNDVDVSSADDYSFLRGEWIGRFEIGGSFFRINFADDSDCFFETYDNTNPASAAPCHYAYHGTCKVYETGMGPNQHEEFDIVQCVDNDRTEVFSGENAGQVCKDIASMEIASTSIRFTKRSDTELFSQYTPPFVMYKQ